MFWQPVDLEDRSDQLNFDFLEAINTGPAEPAYGRLCMAYANSVDLDQLTWSQLILNP